MTEALTQSDLNTRFISDHQQLKGKASVLRSLALQVMRGDVELGRTLILKGQDLQIRLVDHMRWEEEVLLPQLRRYSEEAGKIAEQISSEHCGQRILISKSLQALGGGSPPVEEIARDLLELTDWLERDMEAEERSVLGLFEAPSDSA
jgi:hypothetical protein